MNVLKRFKLCISAAYYTFQEVGQAMVKNENAATIPWCTIGRWK